MTIVNQGASGAYHIFRGEEARMFLAGQRHVGSIKAVIILPDKVRVIGMFYITPAHTGILALDEERISDHVLKLAYRQAWKKCGKELRRVYGSA